MSDTKGRLTVHINPADMQKVLDNAMQGVFKEEFVTVAVTNEDGTLNSIEAMKMDFHSLSALVEDDE